MRDPEDGDKGRTKECRSLTVGCLSVWLKQEKMVYRLNCKNCSIFVSFLKLR